MTAAAWAPQPGSQPVFLSCPAFECLYEGTRGPGKTDALIMDFCQHVGRGHGAAWRGILFRETYPQLGDVVAKTRAMLPRIFPGAELNESKMTWRFPQGEELLLRHMRKPEDYWNYHGHSYPWVGWEELTNWADDRCYTSMMSTCRSTAPGVPRKYRATTNPYGRGHNWVKARFQLPGMRGRVIRTPGKPDRVAVHGHISENRALLDADPLYLDRLRAAASNPAQLEAWLDGSWDITSGGMFDDLWDASVHVLRVQGQLRVPRTWAVDRSFDWGSSRPFSVGWWGQSDGTPMDLGGGRSLRTVRGDLVRLAEWYGLRPGTANEGLRMLASDVAEGIRAREAAMGLGGRVRPGPADSSIFDEENGVSIARDMLARGVRWEPADKSPGSRKQGWEATRRMLRDACPPGGGLPRERPGLFVSASCVDFLRTVPSIPRSDDDPDDVDTEAEDHAADEVRYRVRHRHAAVRQGSF